MTILHNKEDVKEKIEADSIIKKTIFSKLIYIQVLAYAKHNVEKADRVDINFEAYKGSSTTFFFLISFESRSGQVDKFLLRESLFAPPRS